MGIVGSVVSAPPTFTCTATLGDPAGDSNPNPVNTLQPRFPSLRLARTTDRATGSAELSRCRRARVLVSLNWAKVRLTVDTLQDSSGRFAISVSSNPLSRNVNSSAI